VTRPIALILIALGCLTGTAAAEDPPLGAYQEPAPRLVPESHATGFVNELLERRGGPQLSQDDLRKGVVVQAARGKPKGPKKAVPRSQPPKVVAAPRLDSGPAERAGVTSPADADQPGLLVGLVVAGLLGALGLALWLTDSRKKA
jgi:hypothetical protein